MKRILTASSLQERFSTLTHFKPYLVASFRLWRREKLHMPISMFILYISLYFVCFGLQTHIFHKHKHVCKRYKVVKSCFLAVFKTFALSKYLHQRFYHLSTFLTLLVIVIIDFMSEFFRFAKLFAYISNKAVWNFPQFPAIIQATIFLCNKCPFGTCIFYNLSNLRFCSQNGFFTELLRLLSVAALLAPGLH